MQRYTPLFNALLAAVPYLTREDLPKLLRLKMRIWYVIGYLGI